MNLRKADDFIDDVERQFVWYQQKAGLEIADRYLDAVEATCQLLGRHPTLGPRSGFRHPRLVEWRFFLVFKPFNKHILFYEIGDEAIVLRRAMHGRRDLPRRLLERPGAED